MQVIGQAKIHLHAHWRRHGLVVLDNWDAVGKATGVVTILAGIIIFLVGGLTRKGTTTFGEPSAGRIRNKIIPASEQ